MGGFYLSDGFTNLLYENPGNSNNWIGIILQRDDDNTIFGSKITLQCNNESTYNSYVDNGGSFGSSSLIQTLGLNECDNILELKIDWANSNKVQHLKNVEVNQYILIREFEDAVHYEFAADAMPGFVHLYVGEEASAMGICMNLNEKDTIASTHRGH